MRIAIGSDHTAIELRKIIIEYLKEKGVEVVDVGPDTEIRTHYPIYAAKVAKMIQKNEVDRGILICGTGVGMSIAANKFKHIRACVCSEPYSAKMSIEHNNANVLAFGARVVGSELAKLIVETWLNSKYEGGRHQERVDMILEFEEKN